MKRLRVVLADDHGLVRAGVKALMQDFENVEVVAEASDGREVIQLVEQTRPDVVVMDIAMKGLNGLDATARLTREFPGVAVLILSMHGNEEYVWQALSAGASGYLLKDAATQELQLALQAVSRGETYLSPAVSKHVISNYIGRVGGEAESLNPFTRRLTPRQREILQLIAEGHTTKEIAQTLSLSVKTVETHRAQLMDRLDIHDVAGLVRYAIRIGLVGSDT